MSNSNKTIGTATNTLIDTAEKLLICGYRRSFIEYKMWAERDQHTTYADIVASIDKAIINIKNYNKQKP